MTMLLRLGEVQAELALSRSTIYRLVRSGELPARRVGRALRVEREALDRFVAALPEAAAPAYAHFRRWRR